MDRPLRIMISKTDFKNRRKLDAILKKRGESILISVAETTGQFVKDIEKENSDLVLFDTDVFKQGTIKMIDFVRKNSKKKCLVPLFVVISKNGRLALKAFEVNVFDYIVKPVQEDRLLKTIERARFLIEEISTIRNAKYENSSLNPEDADRYLEQLLLYMKEQKPYLEGDLKLNDLAEQLSIPKHHLSQVINEKLNKNFFEFVNSYRIDEAKRILADPYKKDYKILRVAFESGFNNKTTFNNVFKRIVNTTPSEFRRE